MAGGREWWEEVRGKGEAWRHDVDGVDKAARDAARHGDDRRAQRELQEGDEEHPAVGEELLSLLGQQPSVEVAEEQQVRNLQQAQITQLERGEESQVERWLARGAGDMCRRSGGGSPA